MKVGPNSGYIIYYGIRYQWMGSCEDWLEKYIIYIRLYKLDNYIYNIRGYKKGKSKIYVHVTPNCVNCMGVYITHCARRISRHKVEINIKKEKKPKKLRKKKSYPVVKVTK